MGVDGWRVEGSRWVGGSLIGGCDFIRGVCGAVDESPWYGGGTAVVISRAAAIRYGESVASFVWAPQSRCGWRPREGAERRITPGPVHTNAAAHM